MHEKWEICNDTPEFTVRQACRGGRGISTTSLEKTGDTISVRVTGRYECTIHSEEPVVLHLYKVSGADIKSLRNSKEK